VGRQITIRVGSVAIVRGRRPNVAYWHLTDKPPTPEFVAYWTNNGQKAVLGLDLSAAIDPKRTWSRST